MFEDEYGSDHEPPQWNMEVTSDKSKSTSSETSDSGEKAVSPQAKNTEKKTEKRM